jgi:MEDS: MEthanogen/methylotroph, DcmR Sensory domain
VRNSLTLSSAAEDLGPIGSKSQSQTLATCVRVSVLTRTLRWPAVMRMIIITLAPARSQQSYRHEAFLWHDASDFTAGIVPFIRDGLEAGEPVMVAVSALHTKWLREAVDGPADVEFVDIEELGRNPAQIIPA